MNDYNKGKAPQVGALVGWLGMWLSLFNAIYQGVSAWSLTVGLACLVGGLFATFLFAFVIGVIYGTRGGK